MSLDLTYVVPGVDVSQLHMELIRAGLMPEAVLEVDDTVYLTMSDHVVEADVDAVVAAHVPKTHYDPVAVLAARAPVLAADRNRGRLFRLRRDFLAASDVAALAAAGAALVEELQRRDRSV